jgi:hypothetical protein
MSEVWLAIPGIIIIVIIGIIWAIKDINRNE